MNLRTKLILNICVFMLLVCGLLTANIVMEATARAKADERRHAEFVTGLVSDWVRGAEEFHRSESWPVVEKRLAESAVIAGWIVAYRRGDELVIGSSQPLTGSLDPKDESRLREAIDFQRISVKGAHVYAPIQGKDMMYAARLDLREAAPGSLAGGLPGLVLVMALGTALLVLNAYIFLNRFVLRPLDSLIEASRRVSEGDFSKKVPERPTYDEMTTLINAFNLMFDRIAKHQAGLLDDVRRARERITNTEKRLFAAQRLSTTGTLAAGIAHEINNPLGGMINAARTIKGGALGDDKRREYLELIVDGLERIRAIVQKVLQFRPKELEPQAVSLKDVVTRAVSFLDHRARHKGVEVKNEMPEDLPQAHGDPLELQQAVLNVLMNAVDACIQNEGVVRATGRRDEASVWVEVSDNGCGMDDNELAHCMDLFYTTKDVGEGTGLGLAVAQNIVHNHGGKIEIRSEKGKGTTVAIRLPILRAATARLPAAEKTT